MSNVYARNKIRKQEMITAKNRYGVDMQYFHKWIERSLTSLTDYKPDELARELARMSRTADSEVFLKNEFSSKLQSRIAELEQQVKQLDAYRYMSAIDVPIHDRLMVASSLEP